MLKPLAGRPRLQTASCVQQEGHIKPGVVARRLGRGSICCRRIGKCRRYRTRRAGHASHDFFGTVVESCVVCTGGWVPPRLGQPDMRQRIERAGALEGRPREFSLPDTHACVRTSAWARHAYLKPACRGCAFRRLPAAAGFRANFCQYAARVCSTVAGLTFSQGPVKQNGNMQVSWPAVTGRRPARCDGANAG